MHFITKTINFIRADGRGSTYRLAEHNDHKFLVVFDEDMDMRVMTFMTNFAAEYAALFKHVDYVGERKGSILVVFNPTVLTLEDEFGLNCLIEDLAQKDHYTNGDAWGGNAAVGFKLKAEPFSDWMTSMFYPCNHRAATLAQMFAALKVARGLRRIEISSLQENGAPNE